MPNGIYRRTILYMLLAVAGLYFLKAITLREAFWMTIGVITGSMIGLLIVRYLRERKKL